MTRIKICGIKTPDAMEAAIYGGADFVGLVFHPLSPRHVDIEVAAYLSHYVPKTLFVVGLFVNPSDDDLIQVLENVRLDMIQLSGNEPIERVQHIAQTFKKPIIKSFSIQTPEDLHHVTAYEPYIDWILLDSSQGGSGEVFDWSLLKNASFSKPWMLAGGLNDQNVGDAITRLSPDAVDVSSGVESVRGVKDVAMIKSFIERVKNA